MSRVIPGVMKMRTYCVLIRSSFTTAGATEEGKTGGGEEITLGNGKISSVIKSLQKVELLLFPS